MSFIGLILTLGGPECLLGPAGESENDSRFFAEPTAPFSGVLLTGLATRDLALVDSVEAM